MPKMPRYTASQLKKILESNGWFEISQSGSHCKLRHAESTETIILPIHTGDLGTGLTSKLMKQAGLK